MARKKKHEEHENHERWLVSYADFITLLFAFFVVMYSMSSVNEGKYRVLSESMTAAFRPLTRSLSPIQIGEPVRSIRQPEYAVIMDVPVPINIIPEIPGKADTPVGVASGFDGELEEPMEDPDEGEEIAKGIGPDDGQSDREGQGMDEGVGRGDGGGDVTLEYLGEEVEGYFEELINADQVEIRQNPLWLEIEIQSNVLFKIGSAELEEESVEILANLGEILSPYPNPLMVEGFTDNMPIGTSIFPSNWELSSARAGSVVRLFENAGVDSVRMSSVGFGEHRPKADNETPEGRAKNRRVVVVVMTDLQSDDPMDPHLQTETLEKMRQRYNYAEETRGWW